MAQRPRLVYRSSDAPETTYEASYAGCPDYRRAFLASSEQSRHASEVIAVIDYLWDANALPKTISQDGDGLPDKQAWAQAIWSEAILLPFVSLATSFALNNLSAGAEFTPWGVERGEVEQITAQIARSIAAGTESVSVVCPLIHTGVAPDILVTLSTNAILRSWDTQNLCAFLTHHCDEYLPNDLTTSMSEGALEINLEGLPANSDDIAAEVVGQVDLIKWAFMVATNGSQTIGEGAIILTHPWGWRGQTIRRVDPTYARGRVIEIPQLTAPTAEQMSHLVSRAQKLMKKAPDLKLIVSFLGRAIVAPTSRDSVLEAAIGLESLLVPDKGENAYKFRLHGSALLAAVMRDDVESDLKIIYDLRSTAAHGSNRERTKYDQKAPRSRFLLAKAIEAAIHLEESGELRLEKTQYTLAEAIRDLVKRRCCSARE